MNEIVFHSVDSFRTFRLTFEYRHPDPRIESSVGALAAWYAELDRDMDEAVAALSEDEIATRRIVRSDFDIGDFSPLPATQLDIYREALLIFYGRVSVYLRAMGRPLPGHWQAWIGRPGQRLYSRSGAT